MKTLNIIIFLLAISSCSFKGDDRNERMRPNGIPEKAFWVGGADGGNWYLVEDIHNHKNNAFIKIYNDNDGSLIVSKRFILVCPANNQLWIDNLREQIDGFDGEKIHFKSTNKRTRCYLQ